MNATLALVWKACSGSLFRIGSKSLLMMAQPMAPEARFLAIRIREFDTSVSQTRASKRFRTLTIVRLAFAEARLSQFWREMTFGLLESCPVLFRRLTIPPLFLHTDSSESS